MKILKVLLFILLLPFASVVAETPIMQDEANAEALYMKAVSKDAKEEDVEKAYKVYEDMLRIHPKIQYEFRLAPLIALKAKFTILPNKKIDFVNKSIAYFEDIAKRIEMITDKNIIYEFHLYRGRTFAKLPNRFNVKDTGLTDLKTSIELGKSLNKPSAEIGGAMVLYASALKDAGKQDEAKIYASEAKNYQLTEEDKKLLNSMF